MTPIIRIIHDQTAKPGKEIYVGAHPSVPAVGEYICIQYWNFKVWRVEHILKAAEGNPNAVIYIREYQ